jgi:hypothetical protein
MDAGFVPRVCALFVGAGPLVSMPGMVSGIPIV